MGVFGSPLSNEWRLIQKHFRLSRAEILGLARDNPELAAEKVAAAHTRYSAQADHTTSDPTPAPAPSTAPLTEVDAWYEQRLAELRQQLDELVAERARTIAPAQPAEDTQQGFRDGL